MNTVDLIMLVFLALCALQGLRIGLVRSVGGLIALIIGIWAGITFRMPVVYYLENTFGWVTKLEAWLIKKIIFFQWSSDTNQLIVMGEPSQFDRWLAQMKTILLPPMSQFNPAGQIAMVLISALAFLLIFLLVRFLAELAVQALDHLVNATPLVFLNRLLGSLAGIIKGLLYAMVLSLVLLPILKTSAFIGSEFSNRTVQLIYQSFFFGVTEGLKQFIGGFL